MALLKSTLCIRASTDDSSRRNATLRASVTRRKALSIVLDQSYSIEGTYIDRREDGVEYLARKVIADVIEIQPAVI
jgi:hypothetical protein